MIFANNESSQKVTMSGMRLLAVIALIIAGVWITPLNAQNEFGFDHDDTRFPLDFVHSKVSCDDCHVQGVFLGTPTQCYVCHSRSGRIQASAPSPQHIRTTQECEFCHQTASWDNVPRVDHFAVTGSCQDCHNSVIADGKTPDHVLSGDNCDDCHRPFSWSDAVYDHSNITDRA